MERPNPSGRLILVGQPHEDGNCNSKCPVSMFEGSGKTIKAIQGGMTNPTVDIPRYIDLALRWETGLRDIHTHTYTLDEVNDAFDLLRSGMQEGL